MAVLERLFCAWNVRQLTFQRDREPHSLAVESSVERLGESMNIKVTLTLSPLTSVLYHLLCACK